jgi:hypothetical protein
MQLNRKYSEICIETDNSIDEESKIKAFNIDDVRIIVDDESIMSVIGENVFMVSRDEFLKTPMISIKRFSNSYFRKIGLEKMLSINDIIQRLRDEFSKIYHIDYEVDKRTLKTDIDTLKNINLFLDLVELLKL